MKECCGPLIRCHADHASRDAIWYPRAHETRREWASGFRDEPVLVDQSAEHVTSADRSRSMTVDTGGTSLGGSVHYRTAYSGSVRGRPKWGKMLRSPNQVMAEMRSPSSVSTISPWARAIAACASGT